MSFPFRRPVLPTILVPSVAANGLADSSTSMDETPRESEIAFLGPYGHWEPTDDESVHYAAALGASRGEDAILIMNRPLIPKLVDGAAVTLLAELYDSMIEEENFYIYRLPYLPPNAVLPTHTTSPEVWSYDLTKVS
jgi:hypothetical protein